MNQWFRFYNEVRDDPKVQSLPCPIFKFWVNLLCLASENHSNRGSLPPIKDVAFKLKISKKKAETVIEFLVNENLIYCKDGIYHMHGWEKRQFQSDVSTERVKRFRNAHRNVPKTVSETPPDTDTDTDTEYKTSPNGEVSSERSGRASSDALGLPLNDGSEFFVTDGMLTEWRRLYPATDPVQQMRSMRGWLLSNPTKRKTKRGILRFCNTWLSKEQDRSPGGNNGQRQYDFETRGEALIRKQKEAGERAREFLRGTIGDGDGGGASTGTDNPLLESPFRPDK